MRRVGIYSGTFDPVHNGHLAFAAAVLAACRLDKVFFMVEPRPRRKQGVKALEHRDAMARLAIRDNPKFGSIILGQQKFTVVDTLPALMERFKGAELYLLMGDDALWHLAGWPHIEELAGTVRLVIGLRKTAPAEARQRMELLQQTSGLAFKYRLLKAELPQISSSRIRQQLKRGNKPDGLPPRVEAYINQQRLYASSKIGS